MVDNAAPPPPNIKSVMASGRGVGASAVGSADGGGGVDGLTPRSAAALAAELDCQMHDEAAQSRPTVLPVRVPRLTLVRSHGERGRAARKALWRHDEPAYQVVVPRHFHPKSAPCPMRCPSLPIPFRSVPFRWT